MYSSCFVGKRVQTDGDPCFPNFEFHNSMIFASYFILPTLSLNLRRDTFYSADDDSFMSLREDMRIPSVHVAFNEFDSYELSMSAVEVNNEIEIRGAQDKDTQPSLATLQVKHSADTIGWTIIDGHAESVKPLPMYAVGYMEGLATASQILQFFSLNADTTCREPKFRSWLSSRYSSMVRRFRTSSSYSIECDRFYQTAQSLYAQLFGILDGYNHYWREEPANQLDYLDILCMNSEAQLSELQRLADATTSHPTRDRCSAIVTVDDHNRILVAHSTWATPNEMISRTFKFLKSDGVNIQLSSYPGFISSTDDWTLTPDVLLVTETSLSATPSLGDARMPDFIRVMAAHVASKTAEQWVTAYSKCDAPSGTYPSQWLIVDLARSSLWSLATGDAEDITAELMSKRKIGSFNGPVSSILGERATVFRNTPALSNVAAVFDLMEKTSAFAVLPAEGRTGAADWKITGQGIGGSVVMAGPPLVEHQYLTNLLRSLQPDTPWDKLPIVLMQNGSAVAIDLSSV